MAQDLGLEGKVAIVAGGGARGEGIGNGRAAAILLARAGAQVFVVDRDEALATRTVEMIVAEGGDAAAHGADLTQEDQCEAMVATAVKRFGWLDILDNNVGIGSSASVVEESAANWERVMRINVEAMFLTSKYAIPAMIESGGGSIVNISSISALRPRGLTAYSTSKGAVIALTDAMAVDHATDGIRVNCIAPGPVYTPMVNRNGDMSDAAREQRRKSSLLEVEGTGWDIGNAVVFLSSDWARYITGQTLVVDGGCTLTSRARSFTG
ncbi:MAG: SDR family NAD(P)-dependent oxidoreductase [Rhodospirillaceae bacterium]|nr:SDR family NAD(P)-dependent oxidoreductase [Rhodospirillaceae bacterium]